MLLLFGAATASADSLSVSGSAAQRALVMSGTPGSVNSTVTVGPGTPPNAYRFTSTATITVSATADPFCDPPGTVVQCLDDPGPAGGDIRVVRVEGRGGADNITALGLLPTVTGGVVITGGDGDDTIEARNGAADTVGCGVGTDSASVDATDTVAADCETKTIGTPPPPPPPRPPPPPPPPVVQPPFQPSGNRVTGPPIAIGVSAAFSIGRRGTRVSRLTVKDVPGGVVVRVDCKSPSRLKGGARCPFKRSTITVPNATSKLALAKRFKNRRLAVGTVISVYGAAPGRVGASVKFTIRKGGSPRRSDGCVNAALKRISCVSVNPF